MRELLDKLLVYNRAQMGIGFEIEKADVDLAQECRDEIELLQAVDARNAHPFRGRRNRCAGCSMPGACAKRWRTWW